MGSGAGPQQLSFITKEIEASKACNSDGGGKLTDFHSEGVFMFGNKWKIAFPKIYSFHHDRR